MADRPGGLSAALAAAVLAAVAACASSGFHRHFEEERYERAVEVFEADSSLHDDAKALYRAGLLYGAPDAEAYDPARAVAALERLLRLHPGTDRRPEAERLLALLARIDSLDREVGELTEQLRQLKAVDLEGTPSDTGGPRPR